MKPVIVTSGRVELIADYKNEKEKMYYVRLIGCIETKGVRDVPPQLRLDIPITEENYNTLREEISKSKVEYPVLRFKGELELILDSATLN